MFNSKFVKIGLALGAVAGIGYLAYKGVQKVREELDWAKEEFDCDCCCGLDGLDSCDCDCDCGCDCECHVECEETAEPEVKAEDFVSEVVPEVVPEVKEEPVEEKVEEKAEEKPAKAKKEKAPKAE